jgi:hypothetical protein
MLGGGGGGGTVCRLGNVMRLVLQGYGDSLG